MPTPVASAPLTIPEAAAEYVKIVDRTNRISADLATDASDEAPFTQFQADALAYIRAVRVLDRKLLAVTWPPNVEPWVRTPTRSGHCSACPPRQADRLSRPRTVASAPAQLAGGRGARIR